MSAKVVLKKLKEEEYDATKTACEMAPSRQLLATWTVEAWEKVPEELVRKSFTVCGYKTKEEIANANRSSSDIVTYEKEQLRKLVEEVAGSEALTLYDDPENEAEDEFPEDETEDEDGVGDGEE